MLSRRLLGFALVDLLVVVVIVGILAALVVPAIVRSNRNGKLARDANNLRHLWTLMAEYREKFGEAAGTLPTETGSAFWLKLRSTAPPLLDAGRTDIYV